MAMTAPMTPLETALAARAQGLPPFRATAFDEFAKSGFPHRRTEGWRWSDLRAALADAAPAPAPLHHAPPPLAGDLAGLKPFEIRIVNGRIDIGATQMPEGLRCGIIDAGGIAAELTDQPIAALNAAMTRKAVGIEVGAGVAVGPPILIRHIGAGAGYSFAQTLMRLSEGARVHIIETFEGEAAGFHSHAFLVALKDGAYFDRTLISDTGPNLTLHTLLAARIESNASLNSTALSFGGRLCRHETRARIAGKDVKIDMATAALLSDLRHNDFSSAIGFSAEGASVRQRHKGVVRDQARNVFQGKFRVLRGAQKTDARMNADALLLSDRAESNAKPELEIFADDVQCAHGSTSGALDADAVFYLRQRGLSEGEARAMLIEAFVASAFDNVAHPGVAQAIRSRVGRWLEGA